MKIMSRMSKKFKLFLWVALLPTILMAQEKPTIKQDAQANKMEWFEGARLGIFIHWGIYAVDGISESWSFHNGRISHADYMKQINGFTASNYQPEEWVKLIKESGARYAVITSKHHDGVALWDTHFNDLSIPKKSPAHRDVLTPFVTELRKTGIKTGLYFSLIDWTDQDYPGFLRDSSKYILAEHPEKWNRFLKFSHGQIGELLEKYNPDLWWFDGDWEHTADEWKAPEIRKAILDHNPLAIINGRLTGYGDYDTPEQNIPIHVTPHKAWELCLTMNTSWGYQPKDTEYKTPEELITILSEVTGKGGNLLLDIGPKEDGTIADEQVNILKEMGKWTSKHEEAIFNTLAGIPDGHFHGATSLSKDSTVLYLFTDDRSDIFIKGLTSTIKRATVLGTHEELPVKVVGKISWSPVPGLVFIDVPANLQDQYLTVVKLELDGPVKLYRGKGGFE
ncbi:MAG: alpha-L-fucosidase [Lentimicrobiaceae bacterium]